MDKRTLYYWAKMYASQLKSAEEKGIEKGIEKEKISTARKLPELGFSIRDISKITGLSEKEIKSLM